MHKILLIGLKLTAAVTIALATYVLTDQSIEKTVLTIPTMLTIAVAMNIESTEVDGEVAVAR